MQFDIVHIWASMGPLSRAVAFALALMAVAAVAVVVERVIALERSKRATRRFASAAVPHLEAWDLEGLIAAAEAHRSSALARILGASLRVFRDAAGDPESRDFALELARREVLRRRDAVAAELRRGLPLLASVGSVAPFVGLLGTVLGIITAFQGIAATGSGGLGAVSAGIAEALVETALGLLVAIPAVLLFNYLTARIGAVELTLERAAGELVDRMEHEHGRLVARAA